MTTTTAEQAPAKRSLSERFLTNPIKNIIENRRKLREAKEPYLRTIASDRANLIRARRVLRAARATNASKEEIQKLTAEYERVRDAHASILLTYHSRFNALDADVKVERFLAIEKSKLQHIVVSFYKDKRGKDIELGLGHLWRGGAIAGLGTGAAALAILIHGINAAWRIPIGIAAGVGMNILLKKYGIFDFLKKDIEESFAQEIALARLEVEKGKMTHAEYAVAYSTLIKKHRDSRFARQWTRRAISGIVGIGAYTWGGDTIAGQIGAQAVGAHENVTATLDWVTEQASNPQESITSAFSWVGEQAGTTQERAAAAFNWIFGGVAHAQELAVDSVTNGSVAESATSVTTPVDEKPVSSGAKMIESAEAVTQERVVDVSITRLGTGPFANSREEAFSEPYILEAADVLVRGGLAPEFYDAFIAAAQAQAERAPDYSSTLKENERLEAMSWRDAAGVAQALGEGADGVRFVGTESYAVERFSFVATGPDGNLYQINIVVPEICYNFSLASVVLIETPEAPLPAPIVVVGGPETCPPVYDRGQIHERLIEETSMTRGGIREAELGAPWSYSMHLPNRVPVGFDIMAEIHRQAAEIFTEARGEGGFGHGREFVILKVITTAEDGCDQIIRVFCLDRNGNISELYTVLPRGLQLSHDIVLTPGTPLPFDIQLDNGEVLRRGSRLGGEDLVSVPQGTVIPRETRITVRTGEEFGVFFDVLPRNGAQNQ